MTTILGIKLHDRLSSSEEFQKILSKYGCIIRTRLGLHEVDETVCKQYGIIILELVNNSENTNLISELRQLKDLTLGVMEI